MNADRRLQIEALLREGHSDLAIHQTTGAARTTADSPACRHGHAFPEHRGYDSNGWLYCLECRRIRNRARYQPAQPDPAAIERATAGDPPEHLTPRERAAAISQLDTGQLPAQTIAARIHCSKRTVHRARGRAREQVAA